MTKVNNMTKENAQSRSHLVNYAEERQTISTLQGAIVLNTHRDSWVLQVDRYHPNHSKHDQESKLMAKVFHRNMKAVSLEGHTSVSLVLGILQLISQKA